MKYLISILLTLCVGCIDVEERSTWKVELITPNGEVNEVRYVESHGRPYINTWGDLRIIDSGGNGRYVKDAYLPESWRWRIVGKKED